MARRNRSVSGLTAERVNTPLVIERSLFPAAALPASDSPTTSSCHLAPCRLLSLVHTRLLVPAGLPEIETDALLIMRILSPCAMGPVALSSPSFLKTNTCEPSEVRG